MDVTTTQMLLVWTLLGLLLAWMVTFTALALRSNPSHTVKLEDLPTPADSFPAASTTTMLYTKTPIPVQGGINKRHDTSGEMEPVTVTS